MNDQKFQRKLEKLKVQGERYKQVKEIMDEYGDFFPKKKAKKVSNIMLVISVIAIVLYTAANFWLGAFNGTYMDPTLTTCFYTFWGSELFLLAGIKTGKIIKGTDYSQECPEENEDCR